MSDWIDYSVTPPAAGVYEWSVPLVVAPDMTVTVLAHMRKRGAAYREIISPAFDYWDGYYRVTVPAGTHWRPATAVPDDFPTYRETIIGVVGCEFDKCPFCHQVPRLVGVQRSGNGVSIGAHPHEFNTWWLECCSWAKSPHMKTPRALAESRHALLAAEAS
jgi:hypothetical protein